MKNQKQGIWVNEKEMIPINNKKDLMGNEIATRFRRNGGYTDLYLPDPDIVLRKLGLGLEAYRELLSDAHLGSCIDNRQSGVKSQNWKITPNGASTKEVELLYNIFEALDLDQLIGEILNAPLFGFQPIEITWHKFGNFLLPEKVEGKPPEWFVFNDSNELRFRSSTSIEGEELPPGKFILVSHKATYMNPYGQKVLSRCYWPATFKKGGIKFWTTFVERFGGAFAIGKHPRGAQGEEIEHLADMLECLIQSAVAAVPDDSSVEIITAGGKSASGALHQSYCEFHNAEISKAVVGQTLTTEVGANGSYAASQTHADVRADIVESDSKLAEKALQDLIRLIHQVNFNSSNIPKFKFWADEEVDKEQAERDKTLSDTNQFKFTEQYWIKKYGFEKGDIIMIDSSKPKAEEKKETPNQFSESAEEVNQRRVPEESKTAKDDIDQLLDELKPEDLQKQMNGILKPIIELIQQGDNFEEVMEKLVETYDNMSPDTLIEMLERAFFVVEVWERLNAE